MESRTTAALLLAVLVVLAGCAASTDVTTTATTTEPDAASTESDATATTERTTGSTTPGTTLDPATADLPPGVTAAGVENASRLLAAHREALSETGYRFRSTADTSLDDGYASQSVSRGAVAENFAQFRIRSEAETRTGNRTVHVDSDTWGNESVVLTRYSVGNRTQYQKLNASTDRTTDAGGFPSMRTVNVARQASQSQVVRFALRTGEYEVAGVEARNGGTLTTLRATELDWSFDGASVENASRYDSTLVVDERGRVHRLNTTLRAEKIDVRYGFEITEFGDVSVEYPEWAGQALATVNARIDVDSGEGYFTVSNGGGDALPSGSEIRASHDGVNATLELDDPLAPGEQVYVYFPEDGEEAVLAAEPPAENATTELQGEYEFEVVDPTGQALLNAGFGFDSASEPATTDGEDGTSDDEATDGEASDGETSDDGTGESGHGARSSGGEGGTSEGANGTASEDEFTTTATE